MKTLILIISLLVIASSLTCKTSSSQSFNLLESPELSAKLTSDGTLDFSQETYQWKAQLPQPKKNAIFKFKFQRGENKNVNIFEPMTRSQIFGPSTFMIHIQKDNILVKFWWGEDYKYIDFRGYIDDKIDFEPVWISLYFQKDSIELYYDGKLISQISLKEPKTNLLDMFNAYHSEGIYYLVNTGIMKPNGILYNLEVYNDLNKHQKQCLLLNQNDFLPFFD